jgi:hypothetical protein
MRRAFLVGFALAIGVTVLAAHARAQFGGVPTPAPAGGDCAGLRTREACEANELCTFNGVQQSCSAYPCSQRMTQNACVSPRNDPLSMTCFWTPTGGPLGNAACISCDEHFPPTCPTGCVAPPGGSSGGFPPTVPRCTRNCSWLSASSCNRNFTRANCQVDARVPSAPRCALANPCADATTEATCRSDACAWSGDSNECLAQCAAALNRDRCAASRSCQWDDTNPAALACVARVNCNISMGPRMCAYGCGFDTQVGTCRPVCEEIKEARRCGSPESPYCRWRPATGDASAACVPVGVAACSDSDSALTCFAADVTASVCVWLGDGGGGGQATTGRCVTAPCYARDERQCATAEARTLVCFAYESADPGTRYCGGCNTSADECVDPACTLSSSGDGGEKAATCARACFSYGESQCPSADCIVGARVNRTLTDTPPFRSISTTCFPAPPGCSAARDSRACLARANDGCAWLVPTSSADSGSDGGGACMSQCGGLGWPATCAAESGCRADRRNFGFGRAPGGQVGRIAPDFDCSVACWRIGNWSLPNSFAPVNATAECLAAPRCQWSAVALRSVPASPGSSTFAPASQCVPRADECVQRSGSRDACLDNVACQWLAASAQCAPKCQLLLSTDACAAARDLCNWSNGACAEGAATTTTTTTAAIAATMTSAAPATTSGAFTMTTPQRATVATTATRPAPPPATSRPAMGTSRPAVTSSRPAATSTRPGNVTATRAAVTGNATTATPSTTTAAPIGPTTTPAATRPQTTVVVQTTSSFDAVALQLALARDLGVSPANVRVTVINGTAASVTFVDVADPAALVQRFAAMNATALAVLNITSASAAPGEPDSDGALTGARKVGLLVGAIVGAIALAVAAVVVYRKFFAGGDDAAGPAGKGAHASSTAARGRGTRASAFDLDFDEAGEGFLQGEAESMQVLRAAAPMRR